MSIEAKTVQRYQCAQSALHADQAGQLVSHSDYATLYRIAFEMGKKADALEARCAELEAALQRVIPEREICEDDADGDTCCELSNGDVRAAIKALANAQKEGA